MKNTIKNIIVFLTIIISIVLIITGLYYKKNFAEQTFETLFYNLKYGLKDTNTEVVGIAAKQNLWMIVLLLVLFYLPIIIKSKKEKSFSIKISKLKKSIQIVPINKKMYLAILLIFSLLFMLLKIGFFEYIINQINTSSLFEEQYVEGSNVSIVFPKEKRNLILLFLESMETTLMSPEDGGGWDNDRNYS